MFIRSARLFLRPAFPEDSRELYEAICDAGVVSMMATAPWPYRLADAEEFCARPVDPKVPGFVMTLRGQSELGGDRCPEFLERQPSRHRKSEKRGFHQGMVCLHRTGALTHKLCWRI